MRLLRRRRNQLANLAWFLAKWDDSGHVGNFQFVRMRTSDAGNINTSGQRGEYTSSILSRHQPQFGLCVEPGVRDLVMLFIDKFDWITYTSCAGHTYGERRLSPTPRHVGLLPRSAREERQMVTILGAVADAVGRASRHHPVRLKVVRTTLAADSHVYASIEFLFAKRALARWNDYFSALEGAYAEALTALRAVATV